MKKILYLGWVGHNNLGDDLMFRIFENLAKKLLPYSHKIFPVSHENFNKLGDYDLLVLGGGSLLTDSYLQMVEKEINKNIKCLIWGSGIDEIPKSVLAAKSPLPSPNRLLHRVISNAVYCSVRGFYTYRYLEQIGVDTRKVIISGDPGLLLRQHQSKGTNQKPAKPIVGINWGTTFNKIYGDSEITVEDELVTAAKKLVSKGYRIYIYYVWPEDIVHCKRLYARLNDSDNVTMASKLFNEYELLELMNDFTFTINFKLHANVLSAVSGTPFLALGYRFKVYDFANSIGAEKYVIDTDSKHISEQIINLEKYIRKNREQISKSYNDLIDKYIPLLVKPFKDGLYIN